MPDIVIHITDRRWKDLVRDGGAYGPSSGSREVSHPLGYVERPPISQGDKIYLAAGGLVRGWARCQYLRSDQPGFVVITRGPLSGTTPMVDRGDGPRPLRVRPIRGYIRRWWEPSTEAPLEDWRTRGLPGA